tara:strand:- start:1271 stop:2449 length:1179 start_codon:yes stop_codon:yes gene_type:complete
MKTPKYLLPALAVAALLAPSYGAAEKLERPKVEVCFVLDTTGSMGGLIQGAKDKIWSIANEMVSTKPAPEIRFGLIGYRDKGDAYITKVYDLSEDIDAIYGHLMEFKAQGGGDGPESVNQALHESVTKMSWNKSKDVLKIVFLVGDAPPHMDYQDDMKYPEICQLAMKQDLIINTIQCGNMNGTREVWEEIAGKGEGEYAAILQSGGTVAIRSPYDAEISEINRKLNATVVGYGDRRALAAARSKVAAASSAKEEAAADRADYLIKAAPSADPFADISGGGGGAVKVISGDEDLIALIAEKKVTLEELEEEKLPDNLKSMTQEERTAHVEKLQKERQELQQQMAELVKQRGEFLSEEKKRLAAAGKSDGFDLKVKKMIREQAEAKGIKYGTE